MNERSVCVHALRSTNHVAVRPMHAVLLRMEFSYQCHVAVSSPPAHLDVELLTFFSCCSLLLFDEKGGLNLALGGEVLSSAKLPPYRTSTT
jgi:hypothetical protein